MHLVSFTSNLFENRVHFFPLNVNKNRLKSSRCTLSFHENFGDTFFSTNNNKKQYNDIDSPTKLFAIIDNLHTKHAKKGVSFVHIQQ